MANDLISSNSAEMTTIDIGKVVQANIDTSLTGIFKLSGAQLTQAQGVANMYQLKHGLTATIPVICKDSSCPFIETCDIAPAYRAKGGRCLQEIGAMVARFEGLCMELGITERDVVDMGLVKDVIDIEMMIIRADHKIASNADILRECFLAVDVKGNEHTGKEVDPVITLKINLLDKKMKILEKLNSTRKDKAELNKKKKDPSVKTAALMNKMKAYQAGQVQQQLGQAKPNQTIEVESTMIVEVEQEEEAI